jgi:hypothetical protein
MATKNRRSIADTWAGADEQSEPLVELPEVLRKGQPGPQAQPTANGSRKRPRYPSEENRVKATYDLDEETIENLKRIAVLELRQNNPSRVAHALLRWAADLYDQGRITFKVEMDNPNDWWLEVEETQ